MQRDGDGRAFDLGLPTLGQAWPALGRVRVGTRRQAFCVPLGVPVQIGVAGLRETEAGKQEGPGECACVQPVYGETMRSSGKPSGINCDSSR